MLVHIVKGVWRCPGLISWGCCSVPEGSPEHRREWRSAGSSLFVPRPPSSSGSPPLSVAASPALKSSHSLCPGVPPCGYCLVLQDSKQQSEKGMKYSFSGNISDITHDACEIYNV